MNDLAKISQLKEILNKENARPLKSLGQNFLVSEKILQDIVEAAEIKKTDEILEVGPGLGILTEELAGKSARVLAVEKDKTFVRILKKRFAAKNVRIIEQDILKTEPEELGLLPYRYKIVANLPYSITSRFLRKFLEIKTRPESMVLMLQKEVAQRIVSIPPEMSLLSLGVQIFGEPKIIKLVKAGNFWPRPKVDSMIIKIVSRPEEKIPKETEFIFKIARQAFQAKRKTLSNSLKTFATGEKPIKKVLAQAQIKENSRPQEISMEKWIKIAGIFKL